MLEKSDEKPGLKSEAASSVRGRAIGATTKLAAGAAVTVDTFTTLAALSGMYEIQAAEIALRRTRRDDVKEFAHTVIEDHKEFGRKLASCMQAMKTPKSPPDALDPMHQILVNDLEGASDENFDKRYVSQQQAAHDTAITLFRTYRDFGADAELRNLARQGLPLLERHMEMVRNMRGAHA
jgi:putative membrane protein